jgi:hypothetical protein
MRPTEYRITVEGSDFDLIVRPDRDGEDEGVFELTDTSDDGLIFITEEAAVELVAAIQQLKAGG